MRATASSHAAGIFGETGVRPALERLEERVLHDLFGEIEVAGTEHPREPGNHLPRAGAEQMVDEHAGVRTGLGWRHGCKMAGGGRYMGSICRTSTLPVLEMRTVMQARDRLIVVARLDDEVAAQYFLRLAVWPVGHA